MIYDLSLCDWKVKGYYPWVPVKDKSMETGKELQGMTDWIPAKVPGGVHFDLYKAGLIPYPYQDLNSLACEWVENRWWLYQTEIDVSKLPKASCYRLVFEGLDYKARVYLGEMPAAQWEGMYEPLEIVITEEVKRNQKLQLKVLFFHVPDEMGQIGMTSETFTQKSRFNYKWDFSTRLVNIGIWGKCYIKGENRACLGNLHTVTDYQKETGFITVTGTVRWNEYKQADCRVQCTVRMDNQKWTFIKDVSGNQFSHELEIEHPRLWYPRGYGEQPLYDLQVTLIQGKEELDRKEWKAGIRSIGYLENEDSPKGALPYTFVINHKKIYIKGVNMTPLDHIYGNVTREHYEHMTDLMCGMNVNMVRVWGGGIIEQEAFYEACDRKGILVWQEFIQSSSGIDNVPSKKPEFLMLLRKTAECAVTRIRNHTSLAVWSGGNELTDENGVPADDRDGNIKMLKDIVSSFDPRHMFFPTSASGPREFISRDKGVSHDVHGNWNYHGDEAFYELNRNSDSLFHSEFGAEGMCSIRSLNRFISPKYQKMVPASESMVYRHHGEWWCTYERDRFLFGEPKDMTQTILTSAWLQAEGLRFILEANRRRKFHNSGSIIWQINEPWPNVFCTSLVDYYLEQKMAYYWAKNAFSDLAVSMDYGKLNYRGGETFSEDIYVGQETQGTEQSYEISARVQNLRGEMLHSQTMTGMLEQERMRKAGTFRFKIPEKYVGIFVVTLEVMAGANHCRNQYFFGCEKDTPYARALQLENTRIETLRIEAEETYTRWRLKNTGTVAALHLHAYTNQEFHLICDKNYVTLLPGEETEMTIYHSRKFDSGFLEAGREEANIPDIQFTYLNHREV